MRPVLRPSRRPFAALALPSKGRTPQSRRHVTYGIAILFGAALLLLTGGGDGSRARSRSLSEGQGGLSSTRDLFATIPDPPVTETDFKLRNRALWGPRKLDEAQLAEAQACNPRPYRGVLGASMGNQPTWAPAYPASSHPDLWNLVSALTGLPTTDDRNSNGVEFNNAATVRTHYPHSVSGPRPDSLREDFRRALVILRHPMDAIPAFYLASSPQDVDWETWRDANFSRELADWGRLLEYWLDSYSVSLPAGDRYTVAYEDFASSETGHEEALKLAKFLELNDGVDAEMSEDNVTCLWNAIVGGDEEGAASHYLPLKEKQFDLMIYEIERLYSKYHGKDGDIMPILVRYLEMAKTKRNEEIASWSLFSS